MTSRSTGRHRAPSAASTTPGFTPSLGRIPHARPQLSAGPVAKAGAVIAVSSGLVASLGMQAAASPATPQLSTSASGSATSATSANAATTALTTASGVPGSLTTSRQVAAPQSPRIAQGQFGEIGFTATAAPRPAPRPAPATRAATRATRPFASVSRSSTRVKRASSSTSTTDATSSTTDPTASSSTASSSTASSSTASSSIAAGAPGSAQFGAAVLSIAARYNGIAYRYGGTTPAGFDCSGFTSYVLAQVGISLPRTSSAQRAATARISRSEAVPGDLVFMPGHVGIYAGNGMMWDSPRSGLDVSRRPVYSDSATYGRVG